MKLTLALYFSSFHFCSVMMLNCVSYMGDSETCSPTFSQQCPPGNLCAAIIYNYTLPELTVKVLEEIHGCLAQTICTQANSSVLETTYSANVGVATAFLSISCCESDNCNCIIFPEPDHKPNGLQCFSCRRLPNTACSSSISCVGNQDQCITGTVLNLANLKIKGCASKSFCDATFHNSTLGDIHCCSGNLCNRTKAWNRPHVGLLLMILIATKFL